ncbi:methylthioadenosine phosphorylase [Alteromonadaceae bacterium Bs31]|nr:methylthioadenosine phosphorylase [Alteromonadaceae bacterium Bs31]
MQWMTIDSMNNSVAIIGGSGFYHWPLLKAVSKTTLSKYANEPLSVELGRIADRPVSFLARHGKNHSIPPHKINYRANIDALSQLGIKHIIAVNAVGGININMAPGSIVIPDQIIDYTWGREHTFFDEFNGELDHIDFTSPLESPFRDRVAQFADNSDAIHCGGTYACVQGPRLETAAEIRKLARDGCDLVGMTMMPEAALAREKGISYMSICLVCNWAAGMSIDKRALVPISIDEMKSVLEEGLTKVQQLLQYTLTSN